MTSTTSALSSDLGYRKDDDSSQYFLPYRSEESQRLNNQHIFLTKIFGSLHIAPLETSNISRVLDIGCGTGIWAVDFAQKHPTVEVIGVDVTKYPEWESAGGPSNCRFDVVDIENVEAWDKLPKDFDFIHSRFLMTAIRHWQRLFDVTFNHLKPGGYLETQELCWPVIATASDVDKSQSKLVDWARKFALALEMSNVSPSAATTFPYLAKTAGFEEIQDRFYPMHLGAWSDDQAERETGKMALDNIKAGLSGFSTIIFEQNLGMPKEETDKVVKEALEEADGLEYKHILPLRVCVSRKPQ